MSANIRKYTNKNVEKCIEADIIKKQTELKTKHISI